MRDACQALIEAFSDLDGISHAAVVTPGRKVFATAGAGNSLQSDNAWRALADTYNMLDLNKLPAERLLWRFGRDTVVAMQIEDFTLGIVVDTDAVNALEQIVAEQFREFVSKLPREVRSESV